RLLPSLKVGRGVGGEGPPTDHGTRNTHYAIGVISAAWQPSPGPPLSSPRRTPARAAAATPHQPRPARPPSSPRSGVVAPGPPAAPAPGGGTARARAEVPAAVSRARDRGSLVRPPAGSPTSHMPSGRADASSALSRPPPARRDPRAPAANRARRAASRPTPTGP